MKAKVFLMTALSLSVTMSSAQNVGDTFKADIRVAPRVYSTCTFLVTDTENHEVLLGSGQSGEQAATEPEHEYDTFTIPTMVELNDVVWKITGINDRAFSGNEWLKKVSVSDGWHTIGVDAFSECQALTDVTLGTSESGIISEYAFQRGKALTNVTIGEGLKSIGRKAFFASSPGIKTVRLPQSLESIGDSAFCGSFVSTVMNLPPYASIGKYALSSYSYRGLYNKFQKLILSEGRERIPDNMLESCTVDTLIFNSDLKHIGDRALRSNIKYWNGLPDGLLTIGRNTIRYRGSKVTIPESVTAIGDSAFYSSNPDTLVLPAHDIEWGYEVFGYCGTSKKGVELIMPEGLTKIPDGMFAAAYVNNIQFPSTLKEIGEEAFQAVDWIEPSELGHKTLDIPGSVERIKRKAFYEMGVQKRDYSGKAYTASYVLCFHEGLEVLGDSAFFTNGKFWNYIVLPTTTRAIGKDVARQIQSSIYSSNIYSVPYPVIVMTEGDYHHTDYVNSSEVYFRDGITRHDTQYGIIRHDDKYATWINDNETVVVPQVGYDVQINCAYPVHVYSDGNYCGDWRAHIGDGTHACISQDTETLAIPGVTKGSIGGIFNVKGGKYSVSVEIDSIAPHAFRECSQLPNVEIYNANIGSRAFYRCHKLQEVRIGNYVDYVAGDAFEECDWVQRLIIDRASPEGFSWPDYTKSFYPDDLTVYVKAAHLAEWQAKFPEWNFEDRSQLNMDDLDDPSEPEMSWDDEGNGETGVRSVTLSPASATWYTVGGQRLNGQPTRPGLYISNGRKVVIR